MVKERVSDLHADSCWRHNDERASILMPTTVAG